LERAVSEADVVIEAITEQMGVKKNTYQEVEQHAPDHAIFATNTSSLSITELASATDRPGQFCGMHFFNPPVRMQLVEVISGENTTEETMELIEDLAESMGKTPVRVQKDVPGFIVNRVLVPLMNEAAWLVHEDRATIDEVDSATKYDMGLPMGAFELADQVGIDVGYHVLEYMHDTLGDAYEPCPLLVEKVDSDEVGKKAGKGFYSYDDGGVDIPPDEGREDIVRRLQAVMANEVAKLIENDVADAAAIDEAVLLGAGFPDGPAKMADEVGVSELYETLIDAKEESGAARYEPCGELERMVTTGEQFYESEEDEGPVFETIQVDFIDGSIGKITLNRPQRMNSITETMLDELVEAIELIEGKDGIRAILITGKGERAFSAGADVMSMASNAEPLEGVELSRKGQRAFGRLEESPLPVIAAIDGHCLGGGMELATCADLRVATGRSTLGQPEHDLGLLPGWGGTQRLRNIVGEGRAKEIIFTAERYDAETMEEYGFLNDVVDNENLEDVATDLAADLAAGPPIAQKFTKRAMLAGRDDEGAGLEIEANAFGHLLGTEDVMEGVMALNSDEEPDFKGK
ncbi:MAG: enoyl-CoA hydratase-related protein, partial [Halobacteriaceae archaeon]